MCWPCCRLQPIKETREKQIALWCELILDYCRHQKVRCILQQAFSETRSRSYPDISNSLQIYKLSTSAAAEDRLFVNSDISSVLLPIALGMPAGHASGLTLPPHCCRAAQSGGENLLPV